MCFECIQIKLQFSVFDVTLQVYDRYCRVTPLLLCLPAAKTEGVFAGKHYPLIRRPPTTQVLFHFMLAPSGLPP